MDLGKNLEIWIFQGGVICNFEFGLREKVINLDFGGGVICNFEFGLRKKFGNLDFPRGEGGVICNFGFGLREKFGKFGSFLGKNLEIWGGGNLQLRIWT